MRISLACLLCLVLTLGSWPASSAAEIDRDEQALRRTSDEILAAFARGDVPAIMACHHPDVAKALSYSKYLIGRDAVQADVSGTLRTFHMEFVEHRVESLVVLGDTAVEQTVFAVRGTPKEAGVEPFLFRGRAMVVYVRFTGSPTGWASIREVVQPATE